VSPFPDLHIVTLRDFCDGTHIEHVLRQYLA
jgi:hypothetical protein